ncbi:glutamyl-tRNA synthetase [bacterium A37T11]|nr:glutamyl-tRNA synthetase [bacterium A37T11]
MGTTKALIRTRLAPTPSGFLHLGNVLSFSITAALAKQHGAHILLRIDDLDGQRSKKVYIQDIFDTLHFLDIAYDEGPKDLHEFEQHYSQILRMPLYRQALQQLKDQHQVFACCCSRAQLAANNPIGVYPGTCSNRNLSLDQPGVSWRLHTPQPFIVRKKDGHPSYQLASLIDDQHFNVDLIVRGQDLWPSTQAQLYLASVLNIPSFTQGTFYHHPLLNRADGEKLSKSAGDTSIQYLRKQGKKAKDIFGQIGHLLHSPAPINNWEELAHHVLKQKPLHPLIPASQP